jgi:hypothetical protein
MEDARREILTRIARGELSPEEGATLLDELEREQSESAGQQTATTTQLAEPPGAGDLRRIRVVRGFGSIVVSGDSQVREAVAEGPHVAERIGDMLQFKASDVEGASGFTFDFPGGLWQRLSEEHRRHRSRFGWDAFFNAQHPFWTLNLRCNPALALEAVSQAGSIKVEGMNGPISGEVQAGSCTIEDFRDTLDLSLQAGSLRGRGVLDHGESRIRSEAGSVHLILERGSSVKVRARSTMGRIILGNDEPQDSFIFGGGSRELTVGDGAATLEIDATMGSVRVEVR